MPGVLRGRRDGRVSRWRRTGTERCIPVRRTSSGSELIDLHCCFREYKVLVELKLPPKLREEIHISTCNSYKPPERQRGRRGIPPKKDRARWAIPIAPPSQIHRKFTYDDSHPGEKTNMSCPYSPGHETSRNTSAFFPVQPALQPTWWGSQDIKLSGMETYDEEVRCSMPFWLSP